MTVRDQPRVLKTHSHVFAFAATHECGRRHTPGEATHVTPVQFSNGAWLYALVCLGCGAAGGRWLSDPIAILRDGTKHVRRLPGYFIPID